MSESKMFIIVAFSVLTLSTVIYVADCKFNVKNSTYASVPSKLLLIVDLVGDCFMIYCKYFHSCPVGYHMDEEIGDCMPCDCNGNIDEEDPDACDPVTGVCLKCLHNTAGDRCEKCSEFFYGDALTQSCQSKRLSKNGRRHKSCVNLNPAKLPLARKSSLYFGLLSKALVFAVSVISFLEQS